MSYPFVVFVYVVVPKHNCFVLQHILYKQYSTQTKHRFS